MSETRIRIVLLSTAVLLLPLRGFANAPSYVTITSDTAIAGCGSDFDTNHGPPPPAGSAPVGSQSARADAEVITSYKLPSSCEYWDCKFVKSQVIAASRSYVGASPNQVNVAISGFVQGPSKGCCEPPSPSTCVTETGQIGECVQQHPNATGEGTAIANATIRSTAPGTTHVNYQIAFNPLFQNTGVNWAASATFSGSLPGVSFSGRADEDSTGTSIMTVQWNTGGNDYEFVGHVSSFVINVNTDSSVVDDSSVYLYAKLWATCTSLKPHDEFGPVTYCNDGTLNSTMSISYDIDDVCVDVLDDGCE
ncbi:MAG: hypothetical protein H6818_22035 [Phycisphaerales bacterium]|nr:hypothetical protein [Phycisphaerales bacterium]MCB9862472.1 hypothetical protein [Phycisphaerales bacterium]